MASAPEEFIEFEKMATTLSNLKIPKKLEKVDWIVLEKVHGANFSFHISRDGDVRAARRRAMLKENENFFCHRDASFWKTYPTRMKDLCADVIAMFEEKKITQVSVWGELFGGMYEVDGVDRNTGNFRPVQTEIQYCSHIDWIGYDISYRVEDDENNHEYLDYDVAMDLFKRHSILYCQPLYKGAMNVALNWDLNFQSTLPKITGMPERAKGSNTAEGVVVKPLKNAKCKDQYDEEVRVIIKLKSEQFMEVKDTVPPPSKTKNKKQQPQKLQSKVLAYATEQRLTNAISKHGFPDTKDVEDRIVEEFVNDVLVDIKLDTQLCEEYENASETEKAKIKNTLTSKAVGLIKKQKHAAGKK